MRKFFLLLVGAGWLLASAGENQVSPVPIDALFRDYEFSQMAISPDGKYLASVFGREKEKSDPPHRWTALAAFRIDDRTPLPLLDNEDVQIEGFSWVGDHRILVSFWKWTSYGPARGIFSCNPDGTDFVTLVPAEWLEQSDPRVLITASSILRMCASSVDEVLISRTRNSRAVEKRIGKDFDHVENSPGLYRLNVRTGALRFVARDPSHVTDWIVDAQDQARFAVCYPETAFRSDGTLKDRAHVPAKEIYAFGANGQPTKLTEIATDEDEGFSVVGMAPDGDGFYFNARRGGERVAVFHYRASTKSVEGPVAKSEKYEVRGGIRSRLDGSSVGALFAEPKQRVRYFDPRLSTMQKGIDAALPEFVNRFDSWDRDMNRILIQSESPQEPGRFYLFDRNAGTLEMVFQRAPWLKGLKIPATTPVEIPARDGLQMDAYLTRPLGVPTDRPRPLVLLVHGGPWGIRDDWEFDPERIFYASRGYSVLQVNFRASFGYGRSVMQASYGQVGLKMQDDLDDAVAWAVAQGIADPKQVVIAGNSYGGYAALRGVTRDPEKYSAAIVGFAPVNWAKMFDYYRVQQGDDLGVEFLRTRIGDPEKDAERIREVSPINHLSRLKVPLFVQYGDDDERVNFGQSLELVKTLRALKKKFTQFSPPNQREGHGFQRKENRIKAYTEIEKFLRLNVPVQ